MLGLHVLQLLLEGAVHPAQGACMNTTQRIMYVSDEYIKHMLTCMIKQYQ